MAAVTSLCLSLSDLIHGRRSTAASLNAVIVPCLSSSSDLPTHPCADNVSPIDPQDCLCGITLLELYLS